MDAKKETQRIIKFIQDYYYGNKLKGVIIGMSGGKDSALVAALFTKALGKENVIGLSLPCHSFKKDRQDAQMLSEFYGFRLYNFDLTMVFEKFKKELKNIGKFSEEETLNSDLNLKPRLRMASLYYFAALFTTLEHKPYIVAGTSNKSELYVGYFTKGGDRVCDISILDDYSVEDVITLGKYLKVPKNILYKTPSAGLSKQSDEDKLGVTYKEIDSFLNSKASVNFEIAQKIRKLHQQNSHKFYLPIYHKE